jgi:hypothetical protein
MVPGCFSIRKRRTVQDKRLRAHAEGRLSVGVAILAFIIGAILTAFPIVMLHLKDRAYFRQRMELERDCFWD